MYPFSEVQMKMLLSVYSILCTLLQTKTVSVSFQKMKDYHLALFVCVLVAVDVLILFIYTLVEGLRGSLEPMRVSNAENPLDTRGVSMMQIFTNHIQA